MKEPCIFGVLLRAMHMKALSGVQIEHIFNPDPSHNLMKPIFYFGSILSPLIFGISHIISRYILDISYAIVIFGIWEHFSWFATSPQIKPSVGASVANHLKCSHIPNIAIAYDEFEIYLEMIWEIPNIKGTYMDPR